MARRRATTKKGQLKLTKQIKSVYDRVLWEKALEYAEEDDLILYCNDDYFDNMSLADVLSDYIREQGGEVPPKKEKSEPQKEPQKTSSNPVADGARGKSSGSLEETIISFVSQTIDNQIVASESRLDEKIKKSIEDSESRLDEKVKKIVESLPEPAPKEIKVEVGNVKTKFEGEVLHEQFEKILKTVSRGYAPLLTGEAGVGKGILCRQIAKAIYGDDKHFYFSNAVTQEYKITGFVDANGLYHETPFYKAFVNGGLFMLDEMDASIPDVLIILNEALANRECEFPMGKDMNGKQVGGNLKAHKDFKVIACANTYGLGANNRYSGRNQLDMATLDRFLPFVIDYDTRIELAVSNNNIELVKFCDRVREEKDKSGIEMLVTYRGIKAFADLEDVLGIECALEKAITKHLQKDDLRVLISGLRDLEGSKYYNALVALENNKKA